MAFVIAVHNHKGGVGKTTLTLLLASIFTYDLGSRVLILDGDTTQTSIYNKRMKEVGEYTEALEMYKDENARRLIPAHILRRIESNLEKRITPSDFYKIQTAPPDKIARVDFKKLEYDYVFIDLGAKLEVEYMQILSKVDLLLIPFGHLDLELDASFNYVLALANAMRSGTLNPNLIVRPFWNRVRIYTNPLCNEVESHLAPAMQGLNISFLKSRLFAAEAGFGEKKLITTYASPMAALDEKDKMMLKHAGSTLESSKDREYLIRMHGFVSEVIELINTTV